MAVSSALARPAFQPVLRDAIVRRPAAKRSGFFARLIDAIAAANQRRAERDIARWMELRGGKLTDEVERRMERHFLGGSSDWDTR